MSLLRTSNSKLYPAPYLAASCHSPATSAKPRLRREDLRLFVNGEFKPMSTVAKIASHKPKTSAVGTPGNELARTIHYEFVRLGSEFQTSEGALVKLDFVPSKENMDEARKILKGLGYVAGEAHPAHPTVTGEKSGVTIWVEYADSNRRLTI